MARELKTQVTVQVEREVLRKVDEIADKVKLSRSQLCRNLIALALDKSNILKINKLKLF